MMDDFKYDSANNQHGKLTITLNSIGMDEFITNGKTRTPEYASPTNWSGLCIYKTWIHSRVEHILCFMGAYNPRNQFSCNNLSYNSRFFVIIIYNTCL